MTAEPVQHPWPKRIHGKRGETYEERFPRYAYNARTTATYNVQYTGRQRAAAGLHSAAAANARRHGDTAAADLYEEMARASRDAADALEDLAGLARQVAEHYESLTPPASREAFPAENIDSGRPEPEESA